MGDLLRGSAAWRALRNAYPQARLHLWFFTTRPGAPSEEAHRAPSFNLQLQGLGQRAPAGLLAGGGSAGTRGKSRTAPGPDLIIDFEPHGIRTSLLAGVVVGRCKATTVGVDQVLRRGKFYRLAAPGMKSYAEKRGLPYPIEYTERDFVALSALGLERNGLPIELRETEPGRAFRLRLEAEKPARPE